VGKTSSFRDKSGSGNDGNLHEGKLKEEEKSFVWEAMTTDFCSIRQMALVTVYATLTN
jgi:hypothetical protein